MPDDETTPVEQFGLLAEGRRTAVAGAAPLLALQAIELTAAQFDLDRWALLAAGVEELAGKALPAPAASELIQETMQLVDEAEQEDRLDAAIRLAKAGANAARKAKLADEAKTFTIRAKVLASVITKPGRWS